MLERIKSSENEAGLVYEMHIGGNWRAAEGGATFATINPSHGGVIAHVPDARQSDIDAAITAAAAAQPGWAALPPAARAGVFHRAASLFVERQQEFVDMLIAETGSGFGKAMFECSLVPLALAEAAGLTTREIGEIYPSQVPGKINRTMRAPAGVVGVVSPWNFPLYLSLRGFIYALALGNTAVLKPSEDSPIVGGLMLAKLFEDAGFPAGVFNVITTSRDGASMVGDSFVKDNRIAVISFTGSTRVGQSLATACAQAFKPIILELGGKNPMVILDDADLDRAVDLAFFGSFLHQGQICMSCDKILVSRGLYDRFVEKLVAKTVHFVPTNPEEQTCVIGPIINERQLRRIEALVDQAVKDGAKLHCGGKAEGRFYTATVLTDVTRSMGVWNEEIFGPVTTVTPFDSEDEAIALANDTVYGLSASVITGDVLRGELLAERIHAGMVHVNDSTVHDEPHCPFSGLGASGGGGKWGSKGAIEAFTTQRWISTQRQAHRLPF
ncbi:aldehyde dehydrogenase family protein [Rhizobium sp. C1]|uniref:aldehyde dehydrogenase family protein n=1 Tax=Rhizobium sp. C1 TaxID=1349799 RepID=UPI001E3650AB|nr:aldehyde dehydrogenase family protein [Rhizobium sp. C1]MCD2179465.1 aldehyde dehydrogenase family protein [Rhizobium sp. C1]